MLLHKFQITPFLNNKLSSLELKTLNYDELWKIKHARIKFDASQPSITCSKLTIEALEQGVKDVQR